MCGINGIYHPGEQPEAWLNFIRRMNGRLAHRGPDETGYFGCRDVSLAVQRLRVMDLRTGSQPLSNETNTITVVCNGEIYGFEDIRIGLERKGHAFRSRSDSEVLVHLYEDYGLDFFDYFDGMFAFALWDARKQRLIIGRDRFGIKPLFYTVSQGDGRMAFSSEIHSLQEYPMNDTELDPVAIDKFLALSYIPYPHTVYKNIRKLKPGHYLLIEGGLCVERNYWDLPANNRPEEPRRVLESLDAAISESVRKMTRCDVPYGAFLSGGFDSSTVVYNMRKHSQAPFHTYSVRFPLKYFDEGRQARDTSVQFGTQHHEIWLKPDDVMGLPEIMTHFGEPFADPSMIATYYMAREAKKDVTVVLTGDGGDEIYGGYETYCASLFAERFGSMNDVFRRSLEKVFQLIPISTEHVGFNYKIRKFLAGCHMSAQDRHAMWRTGFNTHQRSGMYQAEFLDRLGSAIDRPIFDHVSSIFKSNGHDALTQFQYLDIRTYLIDNNLTKVDRMTMAHALEARIPMLDLGVVKAGLQLPPHLRVRGLQTKIALRKLMADRLPLSVVKMSKKGFGVPLAYWFQGPLKSYVEDLLSARRIDRTGILRGEPVQRILSDHMAGRGNFIRQLFNLVCFIQWYETCYEKVLV